MQVTGTAELQSEVVDLYAQGAQCMDFWYMVQGSQEAQITQMHEVWFHKGQNVTAWTLGRVKIPRRHRVTFQAAVLQSRNGYVALDDIAIYINDDCPTMPAEATAGKTAASPAGKPSDFIYLSCKKLHSSGVMVSSSLDSPIVPLQQTVVCTRFAFHMFGPGKRELMLLLRTRQFQSSMQSRTRVLFRAFGGTVADRWYHVSRTIRFSAHTTTLSFSVSSDKCEQGDVALSNIHVTPGACLDYGGKERCDFEHDICDWHNNGWTHVVTGMTGDMADASLRSGPANSAGFLQLSRTRGAANLTSVLWHAEDQPRTIELWYYGDATEYGMLNIYLVDKAGSPLAKIWTLPNTTDPRTWSLARAEIPKQSMDFKVVIEGKHLCGYVSRSDSDFRWLVGTGRVFKRQPRSPDYNIITSGVGNPGRFAYVDTTVPANNSVTPTATLRSAYFSSKGNETVAVRYFRNGTGLRSFKVYQLVVNSGAKGTIRHLLADLSPGEQWQRVELQLQHKADQSQLEFTLTGSSNQGGRSRGHREHQCRRLPQKVAQTLQRNEFQILLVRLTTAAIASGSQTRIQKDVRSGSSATRLQDNPLSLCSIIQRRAQVVGSFLADTQVLQLP
ncbi:hypothetical protein MRX96_015053 [Rhipicephalus microplus]